MKNPTYLTTLLLAGALFMPLAGNDSAHATDTVTKTITTNGGSITLVAEDQQAAPTDPRDYLITGTGANPSTMSSEEKDQYIQEHLPPPGGQTQYGSQYDRENSSSNE
jgi:hypothetical protein